MTDPVAPSDHETPTGAPRPPAVIDQEGRTEAEAAGVPPPPPEPPDHGEQERTAVPPPPARRSRVAPVFGVLGFLLLAGAIGYLWYQQQHPPAAGQAAGNQALQQQVQQLSDQVARLEQRPAAGANTPVDLQPLQQRVQALQQQVASLEQQPPSTSGGSPDLAPLQQRVQQLAAQVDKLQQQGAAPDLSAAVTKLSDRVAALEQRKGPDLSQIQARLDALEKRQPPDLGPLRDRMDALSQQIAALSQMSQRVDELGQRVQGVAGQSQQEDSSLKQRLDAVDARLGKLEQQAGQIGQLADRATRLARLQAAQMQLAQGQKLGAIQGAPPALARFADQPPPTMAALRLSYPAAEQAALAASSPDTNGKPFFARVMAHAQELVTVRQGDRVLVGDPTAGVLSRARAAVEAGDLAGAVAAVSSLSGAPAKAMSGWLEQAKALLAARSALADMVAQS